MGTDYQDDPVVPPPASVTADGPDRRPVLYMPNGTPLVKRPIGFDTASAVKASSRHIIDIGGERGK